MGRDLVNTKTPTLYWTVCRTCGAEPTTTDGTNAQAHRRWVDRHCAANHGHQVAMSHTSTRVYRYEERPRG